MNIHHLPDLSLVVEDAEVRLTVRADGRRFAFQGIGTEAFEESYRKALGLLSIGRNAFTEEERVAVIQEVVLSQLQAQLHHGVPKQITAEEFGSTTTWNIVLRHA